MYNKLQQLGIDEKVAKIYLSIAQQGPCQINDIFKDTKVHRNTIQKYLEELIAKELVEVEQQQGEEFYLVSNPGKLSEIVSEKLVEVGPLVSDLKRKYKDKFDEFKVEIFTGSEGISRYNKKIIAESPANGSLYYLFTKLTHAMPIRDNYQSYINYEKARLQKGITRYLILDTKFYYDESDEYRSYYLKNTKVRQIDTKGAVLSFFLFGSTVAFEMMFNQVYILTIKNKDFYTAFKNTFDSIWQQAGPSKIEKV